MQVSTSATKYSSGGCTDLFRFQSEESGESSALLPLSGLIAVYGAVLRNASPALVVARGARTWELRTVSSTASRRGVSGRLLGWAKRVHIVGE